MSGRVRIVRTNPRTLRSILEAEATGGVDTRNAPHADVVRSAYGREVGMSIAEAGT